ncbi:hypothetical protein VaNZ11_010504 [Volvox africanus]|uniref:Origin recognition complex subunit 3 N-terminal domain-containing protein n=1 Tax=Volvox africanus TaxID=51714 RepID=A0ABQ5S9X7_9CHLO|nr:hypothetical protein VaNZ11_010504 [Volvox africanus]
MSEWFASAGEEPLLRHEVTAEVLCELPSKLTQRAEALEHLSAAIVLCDRAHGDDLRTFQPLFSGEDVSSRQRRWLGLRAAASKVENAFEAFSRDRDQDDFQRLWVNFLAPFSPQRQLASRAPLRRPVDAEPTATTLALPVGSTSEAIPTLLLSTNGASMADRLDLYGAFALYLRNQHNAYVALLRPEDLAADVGSCFSSALAQFTGLPGAAAEDVLGLVAWYAHETGCGLHRAPAATAEPCTTGAAVAPTPAKGASKTPGRGGGKTPSGKGSRGGKTPGGRGVADSDAGIAPAASDAGEETVAARLRARRGQQGQAAAAAADAEARSARETQQAVHARNRQRHMVLMVEAADRIVDRGALRALLAALHGERHRLPITLVLGLSSPAALYSSKLPVDMASLLQLTAAELAPHPWQLHRLFQDVLMSPQAPPLLLDGATMRELLVQSRLLEPSLAYLRTALLEANEQHFRRELLAPLALLPLQQRQADEAAATAAWRQSHPAPKLPGGGSARKGSDSGSDDEEHANNNGSPALNAPTKEDDDAADLGGGLEDLAAVAESWIERRRQRHHARLEAAVLELPGELLRTTCASLSAGIAKENSGDGSHGKDVASQRARAVCESVAEAFSTLSAWRLGLRWLAVLAERTGAIQLPGGHRYTLPSLYVAAASPRFWKPPAAAVAAAVAAGCSASHKMAVKGVSAGAPCAAAVLAATSLGESLLAGVLGATTRTAGGSGGSGGNGRGTIRALPEEELDLLLDDLMDVAREALLHDWVPAPAVMRAAKGLAELRLTYSHGTEVEGDEDRVQQPGGGPKGEATAAKGGPAGASVDDEASPVRRRLAAQGLTSPPTVEKLKGITERLGRLDPLPAPKCLQPNNAQQPSRLTGPQAQPPRKTATAVQAQAIIKLPTSGPTQSKRQRDQALLAAVQKRADAGKASLAAESSGRTFAPSAAMSLADRAVELLASALRELLGTCPFELPGSTVFTFRDAKGLQQRLLGAPALALHMALTEPEQFLKDVPPGLHPGQEDAAIAYQLLLGCREGTDLRDWLADFCAASGLGSLQEVQQDEPGEGEKEEDAMAEGPMGRSRTSRRRQAPRKRKAPPKQEMVLALDGPQAEAAVDALACRFEQVARELEAVGLCRFSKRRKGLYVHRTYFPPEAVA